MPFTVVRLASVARVVERKLSHRERRAYDAAVQALQGRRLPCRWQAAGGNRDWRLSACQRSLYGPWRMVTAYLPDSSILIVAVSRHTATDSPSARLAKIFPGLSPVG